MPDSPITACLTHADYHVMDPDCWGAVLDWNDRHQHLPEAERRNAYQAVVERRILDRLRCEYGHPHDHPCGKKPEAPGTPCRFCQQPVPLDGSPCPNCWTRLDTMPLADIRALFAADGTLTTNPGAPDA